MGWFHDWRRRSEEKDATDAYLLHGLIAENAKDKNATKALFFKGYDQYYSFIKNELERALNSQGSRKRIILNTLETLDRSQRQYGSISGNAEGLDFPGHANLFGQFLGGYFAFLDFCLTKEGFTEEDILSIKEELIKLTKSFVYELNKDKYKDFREFVANKIEEGITTSKTHKELCTTLMKMFMLEIE